MPDWPAPGVVFKDLTPLLADPVRRALVLDGLVDLAVATAPEALLAVEARGFLLAAPLADRLGLPLVPARKPGKLPRAVLEERYALEYGQDALQVHADAFAPGARVLVVDDVLATGGTAAAAVRLVTAAGASPVGLLVLLELGFLPGRATVEAATAGGHRVAVQALHTLQPSP